MIAYIDMYRDQFGVELICRTLAATEGGFLTSRGYRAAKTRPASDRQLRDTELIPVIERIHADNYGVYGARKIWHAMRREGWDIGRDQVARLMRTAGLNGVIRGRKPRTTIPSRTPDDRPDLVERRFVADRPNRLWVADITYVRTTAGFCYTAFVTDVFSRKIVGWATRTTMRTEDLPLEALEHALVSAKDQALDGLVHHSDRGSQGEFNWSSQHLYQEVFDGSSSAGRGQGGSSEAPLAGASEVSETRRGGVLGRDRERAARGGSRGGCRRGARGRRKMVPTRWRHGAIRHRPAAIGPLPLVR